jgi:hypothetical protein
VAICWALRARPFRSRTTACLCRAVRLVTNAKLILTDKLIAASRPVDASGVDEEDFDGADDAFLEEQED